MVELVTFGDAVIEFAPAAGTRLEVESRFSTAVTGSESNAAVAAARVGTDTAWLSKLPASPLGRRVSGEIRQHGVEVDISWSSTGRQGLAFRERAGNPREDRTYDDRSHTPITAFSLADVPAHYLESAEVVYTTDSFPARAPTLVETTHEIFERTHEEGGKTAFGFRYRDDAWENQDPLTVLPQLFERVDVLCATEADISLFFDGDNQLSQSAHRLASKWGFETVLISREENGALAWDDKTIYEHTAPAIDALDDQGADDALFGAFLSRRIAGESTNDALAFAVATGAVARTIQGPMPTLTRDDVELAVEKME